MKNVRTGAGRTTEGLAVVLTVRHEYNVTILRFAAMLRSLV